MASGEPRTSMAVQGQKTKIDSFCNILMKEIALHPQIAVDKLFQSNGRIN